MPIFDPSGSSHYLSYQHQKDFAKILFYFFSLLNALTDLSFHWNDSLLAQ